MLTDKDRASLVKKVTSKLNEYHARVYIEGAPGSMLDFFENNKSLINGEVVVVRNKDDESKAAYARNHCEKVLFVFSDEYLTVPSYFSGTSEKIKISQALMLRAERS